MFEVQNSSDIAEQYLNLPQTALTLECRMIVIGSYKCIPREKIVISYNGIRFDVPLVEDGTFILFITKIWVKKNISSLKYFDILQIQVL